MTCLRRTSTALPPNGDVKNLPNGSTPVDFAYAIHSAVGNKMVGARVNGKLVNIDYKIQNGDRIEILTSQNSKGPSRDWLNIVKSTQAKNKINQWFKKQFKEENIVRGKELIVSYCRSKNIDLLNILKTEISADRTEKVRLPGLGCGPCSHRPRRPEGRPGGEPPAGRVRERT